jgi:hypothetical protein
MDHIRMAKSEEKNAIVYTFSYGYENRGSELVWVPNVVTARRLADNKWSFDFNPVKDQNSTQLESYVKMLDKVKQVMEHDGMNLMGIEIEKKKPAAAQA